MARDVTDSTPISSRDELVGWLEEGCKGDSALKLGTEHEKFPFYTDDLTPVPYEGRGGRGGIGAILQGVRDRPAGSRSRTTARSSACSTNAPAGRCRWSRAGSSSSPARRSTTCTRPKANSHAHIELVNKVAAQHGIAFAGLGMSPLWSLAETPRMPKSRYRIMTNYMPKVGTRGLDMMYRTCTVQVNVDYRSEADMVRKLRVSIALQPIATALFANSPFTDGKPNGLLSARSEIWRDTDNDRSGMTPFVFEEGFGFEQYVDWVLKVPMYFVKRGQTYHDVAGADFRDLLAGRLPALPGEKATMSDWANHVSTIFPEVRLKRYLEMRGADAGSREHIIALPAFFVGLLYDDDTLDCGVGSREGVERGAAAEPARRRSAPRTRRNHRGPQRARRRT